MDQPFIFCVAFALNLTATFAQATTWNEYKLAVKKEQADYLYAQRELRPEAALFSYYIYDQTARESGDFKTAVSASKALDSWSYLTNQKTLDAKLYHNTIRTRLAFSAQAYLGLESGTRDQATKLTFLQDLIDAGLPHNYDTYVKTIRKMTMEAYSDSEPTSLLLGFNYEEKVSLGGDWQVLMEKFVDAYLAYDDFDWWNTSGSLIEKLPGPQFRFWLELFERGVSPRSGICKLAKRMLELKHEYQDSSQDPKYRIELTRYLGRISPLALAENLKALKEFSPKIFPPTYRCYDLNWREEDGRVIR